MAHCAGHEEKRRALGLGGLTRQARKSLFVVFCLTISRAQQLHMLNGLNKGSRIPVVASATALPHTAQVQFHDIYTRQTLKGILQSSVPGIPRINPIAARTAPSDRSMEAA